MNRRECIRKGGVALSTVTLLSGCSEMAGEVTGGLEITTIDSEDTSFGNIIVGVRVENTARELKSGTLITQVDVEGGDTYTERREISVPGESENTYTNKHDISVETSLSEFRYTYDAGIESK